MTLQEIFSLQKIKNSQKLKRDRFLDKFDKKLQKYLQVNEIYLMTHLSILLRILFAMKKKEFLTIFKENKNCP